MEATLRFELRKDSINKNGEHPLILILRVAGQRKKVPTGIKLFPELWNIESQQIHTLTTKLKDQLVKKYGDKVPLKSQLIKYQDDIYSLVKEISGIENRFEYDGIPYSADMIVETFKNGKSSKVKKEDTKNEVYDLIDQYIIENENTRALGSLKVYKTMKRHLQNFQNITRSTIQFKKIDFAFIQSYQNFLINWEEVHKNTKKIRRLNNITIAKQLTTLKALVNYARRKGIEINNSYKDFLIKREKLEVIALTQAEFDSMYNLDLSRDKRLDQVRDVFCFSCVTGFRYSDLEQLKREHIKDREISLTIKKTKQALIVPINIYSKSILQKYKDRINPIPIISNQKFNKYIKELCEKAEINEPIEIIRFRGAVKLSTLLPKHQVISAHTGRKTFATLSLEKGILAETVMKITGHSDYKSFQRYVKVTEERKRNEMCKAWGAPD